MKKIVILSLLAVFTTSSFAQKPKKSAVKKVSKQEVVATPTTLIQIISYALGATVGDGLSQDFKQLGIEAEWDFVKLGISDAFAGKNQFSMEQMQDAFKKLEEIVAENQKLKSADQREFLKKNKTADGVIETSSGLQYKIITLGTGAKPTVTDNVEVHYHGTLIDGTVFDSSVERGESITFPLNGVIKGWTEGVQLMPIGSKFIFYIPSELGYGEHGAGSVIQPGATLIFEVELLDINPK